MKIIITENQLEKIINRFLNLRLGNLTLEPKYGNIYFVRKGKSVIQITKEETSRSKRWYLEFDIVESGWNEFQEMFNMDIDEKRKIYYEWFKTHYPEQIKNIKIHDMYFDNLYD